MDRCSLTTELWRGNSTSAPKVTFFSQAPVTAAADQQRTGARNNIIEEGCGGGRFRGVGYKAIHQAIR